MTRSVSFITRQRCHLCSDALPLVEAAVRRAGWSLRVIDVDEAGLDFDFGDRVPVVLLDGVEVLAGRFDEPDVHRVLR